MTPEERSDLLRDAERLAYQTIRFTGLYKELLSDEWEMLSKRLGRVTLSYLEALIDEEFTELERAKESKSHEVSMGS